MYLLTVYRHCNSVATSVKSESFHTAFAEFTSQK